MLTSDLMTNETKNSIKVSNIMEPKNLFFSRDLKKCNSLCSFFSDLSEEKFSYFQNTPSAYFFNKIQMILQDSKLTIESKTFILRMFWIYHLELIRISNDLNSLLKPVSHFTSESYDEIFLPLDSHYYTPEELSSIVTLEMKPFDSSDSSDGCDNIHSNSVNSIDSKHNKFSIYHSRLSSPAEDLITELRTNIDLYKNTVDSSPFNDNLILKPSFLKKLSLANVNRIILENHDSSQINDNASSTNSSIINPSNHHDNDFINNTMKKDIFLNGQDTPRTTTTTNNVYNSEIDTFPENTCHNEVSYESLDADSSKCSQYPLHITSNPSDTSLNSDNLDEIPRVCICTDNHSTHDLKSKIIKYYISTLKENHKLCFNQNIVKKRKKIIKKLIRHSSTKSNKSIENSTNANNSELLKFENQLVSSNNNYDISPEKVTRVFYNYNKNNKVMAQQPKLDVFECLCDGVVLDKTEKNKVFTYSQPDTTCNIHIDTHCSRTQNNEFAYMKALYFELLNLSRVLDSKHRNTRNIINQCKDIIRELSIIIFEYSKKLSNRSDSRLISHFKERLLINSNINSSNVAINSINQNQTISNNQQSNFFSVNQSHINNTSIPTTFSYDLNMNQKYFSTYSYNDSMRKSYIESRESFKSKGFIQNLTDLFRNPYFKFNSTCCYKFF